MNQQIATKQTGSEADVSVLIQMFKFDRVTKVSSVSVKTNLKLEKGWYALCSYPPCVQQAQRKQTKH